MLVAPIGSQPVSSEKPLVIDFEYICDFEEEILDPHSLLRALYGMKLVFKILK